MLGIWSISPVRMVRSFNPSRNLITYIPINRASAKNPMPLAPNTFLLYILNIYIYAYILEKR